MATEQSVRVRHSAHATVRSAIKNGILKRLPCVVCGTNKKVQAHHENYSRPLDVTWLCAPHHKKRHIELNPTNNARSTLTDAIATRIKRKLWSGHVPMRVAEEYGISAVSVRSILTGRRWTHIKWPDGLTGAMSISRRREINAAWKAIKWEKGEKAVAKRLEELK